MAPRVSSDLLLVGSLPAGSTEDAFRASAELFGDLVFALPDGETGPRAGWVGYERERLLRPNPGVDTVAETASPTGVPRHVYETPVFRIRPGVTQLHWDSWPRIGGLAASAIDPAAHAGTAAPRLARVLAGGQGGLAVVAHGFHAVLAGLPTEPAVHGDAEIGQVAGGRGLAALQAGDAVKRQDDAQVDAGVAGTQLIQGREEPVVLAAQVARAG